MKDKRGQGISMEFIIIAAIALIVLIVIILFFTGGLEKIFGGQKDVIGTVSDSQKEIWRSQCKLYCSLGQKENFENKVFSLDAPVGQAAKTYKCKKDLSVTCDFCTGNGVGCGTKNAETDCRPVPGCIWESWQ